MSSYYAVVSDLQRLRAAVMASAIATKYDSNQPRVPSGNREGGQWTSVGGDAEAGFESSFQLAARRGRSAKYCMSLYASDSFFCSFVEPASRRAACRSQASERLGSCLAGRPIPPLNY